ncbi:hypothetical protein COLO4_05796 [Corchorus olitorius]|uniref:Uncharacterized protein n=1 Tax=Corchorus olitorius TaxID=93759 RepID=A0A1R3KQ17_9ROSI|nr:hypothetical protein COLO4_05796 [Corchorus olitorius]
MEEYLQYMKTLRSQINDVEDQAANTSAQEQIHLSTIQTMQNDLLSAKSETKQLGEDTEKMLRIKGQICSQIIAKQRKIASLESDSSTLTQNKKAEVGRKDKIAHQLIFKITPLMFLSLPKDPGAYSTGKYELRFQTDRKEVTYIHIIDQHMSSGNDTTALKLQQDNLISSVHVDIALTTPRWSSVFLPNYSNNRTGSNLRKSTDKSKSMVWYFATSSMLFFDKTNTEVKNNHDEQMTESEGTFSVENHLIREHENNEAVNDLIVKLDSAKAKLDGIAQRKAKLVTDNGKIKVSIEQAKHRTSNFKPELLALSIMTLEEEYKALLSDKDGETEYLCSLQNQAGNSMILSPTFKSKASIIKAS